MWSLHQIKRTPIVHRHADMATRKAAQTTRFLTLNFILESLDFLGLVRYILESLFAHTSTGESLSSPSSSSSHYISSSHIGLIRCLAVAGQAGCIVVHFVETCMNRSGNTD